VKQIDNLSAFGLVSSVLAKVDPIGYTIEAIRAFSLSAGRQAHLNN